MPDDRDDLDTVGRKILEAIHKIVKDGGVLIEREPHTVIRAEPTFDGDNLSGGKIIIEIKF